MSALDQSYLLITAFLCVLGIFVVQFYRKAVRVRAFYKDVPGLPHDAFWGHMKAFGDYLDGDKHFDYSVIAVWRALGKPSFYFMDTWPVNTPCPVVICDAELAERLNKSTPERPYSYPKSPTLKDFEAVMGRNSILWVGGEQWKSLRKRYNPGFSSRHLQTLLPEIIQETKIFVEKLENHVGQVITLGEFTTPLTIDIITNVVLGHSVNAQAKGSKLTRGFQGALAWQVEREKQNPFHLFHPLRPFALWYYERQLNSAIDAEIQQGAQQKQALNQRSVLALTLQEEKGTQLAQAALEEARDQIKTFLLAGHDTTSSALQWMYYELSMHPAVLARMRGEHAEIFGALDADYTARVEARLRAAPDAVFAAMPYSTAVFKETLRRRIIAGASKYLPPGSGFTAEQGGKPYCLDGHVAYMPSILYHVDERLWGPDAGVFNPDRWLDTAEWKIPAYAFRAFERGPRACIGQELAFLEARVIMAFTVARFDFEKVYDTKFKELYAIRKITGKPNDGMRMRVKRASERA